jgi:hypothetical protein
MMTMRADENWAKTQLQPQADLSIQLIFLFAIKCKEGKRQVFHNNVKNAVK